jgi:hypothetical protein
MVGKPFVVTSSMHFVAEDVKFGIYATVEFPLRWGISRNAKHLVFTCG